MTIFISKDSEKFILEYFAYDENSRFQTSSMISV